MRRLRIWWAATLLTAAGGAAPARTAGAQDWRPVHTNRAAQADALANDTRTLEVLIAARLGRSAVVAQCIERLNGRIEVRVDTVGYLRVELPASAVERAC